MDREVSMHLWTFFSDCLFTRNRKPMSSDSVLFSTITPHHSPSVMLKKGPTDSYPAIGLKACVSFDHLHVVVLSELHNQIYAQLIPATDRACACSNRSGIGNGRGAPPTEIERRVRFTSTPPPPPHTLVCT